MPSTGVPVWRAPKRRRRRNLETGDAEVLPADPKDRVQPANAQDPGRQAGEGTESPSHEHFRRARKLERLGYTVEEAVRLPRQGQPKYGFIGWSLVPAHGSRSSAWCTRCTSNGRDPAVVAAEKAAKKKAQEEKRKKAAGSGYRRTRAEVPDDAAALLSYSGRSVTNDDAAADLPTTSNAIFAPTAHQEADPGPDQCTP